MYHVEYLRQKEKQEELFRRKMRNLLFIMVSTCGGKIRCSPVTMCRCTGGTI